MRTLLVSFAAVLSTVSVLAQGTVIFNNRLSGTIVAHVYAYNVGNPGSQVGNGPDDFPPGTTDWSGYQLVSGTGFTAQIWAANGANQPESSLLAASPTTTFRTGAAAGFFVAATATLVGVPPDAPVATLMVRVWDNQGAQLPIGRQLPLALGRNLCRSISKLSAGKPIPLRLWSACRASAFQFQSRPFAHWAGWAVYFCCCFVAGSVERAGAFSLQGKS